MLLYVRLNIYVNVLQRHVRLEFGVKENTWKNFEAFNVQ